MATEDFEAERAALFEVFTEARRAGVSLDVDVFQEGRPFGTSDATPLGRALSTHVAHDAPDQRHSQLCKVVVP